MRQIFIFSVYLLSVFELKAQQFIERSFEAMYSTTFTVSAKDSAGNILAAGLKASGGFMNEGVISRINQDGLMDYYLPIISFGVTRMNDIIFTSDQNYLLCGRLEQCDVFGVWGVISKLDGYGNLIWTKNINQDISGYTGDNNLKKVSELSNQSIVTIGDSTMFYLNSTGDSVWAKVLGTQLNALETDGLKTLIGLNNSVLILDTLGNTITQAAFSSTIRHIKKLSSQSYLIVFGTMAQIVDTALNVIDQLDLGALNYDPYLVALDGNTISFANNAGDSFISLDHSLNVTDSFRIQSADVSCNSLVLTDSILTIMGEETSYKNHHYYKTLSVHGSYDYQDHDIGITRLWIDTVYSYHQAGFPPGIDAFDFIPIVTIVNNGSNTLEKIDVSSYPQIGWPICGHTPWIDHFNSLNLAPGDSVDLTLSLKTEAGVSFTNPLNYNYCVWLSNSDSIADKFHANDFYCDSFYVSGVGINDPENYFYSIYPNPVSDVLKIKFNQPLQQKLKYIIYNSVSQVVLTGVITDEIIDVENLEAGFYFLSLISGDKESIVKFVKIGD